MTMPHQSPPVYRPHLVHPHLTVDVDLGPIDQLIAMRMRLLHGANYNDPQAFAFPGYDRMKVSAGWP